MKHYTDALLGMCLAFIYLVVTPIGLFLWACFPDTFRQVMYTLRLMAQNATRFFS